MSDEELVELVTVLLKEGRLVVRGAGAYTHPLHPEFRLDVLPESVWDGSHMLAKLKPGMAEKYRLSGAS